MGRFTPAQATSAIVVSYYWHFVDVVWIGLFATIYLILLGETAGAPPNSEDVLPTRDPRPGGEPGWHPAVGSAGRPAASPAHAPPFRAAPQRCPTWPVLMAALRADRRRLLRLAPANAADDTRRPVAAAEAGRPALRAQLHHLPRGEPGGRADRGPSLIGVGEASVYFQVHTGRMPLAAQEADAAASRPVHRRRRSTS